MDSRPYLKTVLYILSLWLLFLSLLIMSYDKVLIKNVWDYIFTENITLSISSLKVRNIVFIVSLIFIFIGAIILIALANSFGSGWSVACTVSDISNENHEHLEFLTTYIMPLVCRRDASSLTNKTKINLNTVKSGVINILKTTKK